MFRRKRGLPQRRDGVFDPNDTTRVAVTEVGVWKIYTEIPRPLSLGAGWARVLNWRNALYWRPVFLTATAAKNLRYVSQVGVELFKLSPGLLVAWLVTSAVGTVLPALVMYFSGQMLNIVQTALDTRQVDERWLVYIALGRALTVTAEWLNSAISDRCARPLKHRLELRFAQHILNAHLRIDVPTYNDADVQRKLGSASEREGGGAWQTVSSMVRWLQGVLNLVTTTLVLVALLWSHQQNIPLALAAMLSPLADMFNISGSGFSAPWGWSPVPASVGWAATCTDENYIRRIGIRKMGMDSQYKQEIVAGNLSGFMSREFARTEDLIGSDNIIELREAQKYMPGARTFQDHRQLFRQALNELPQLLFIYQVVRTPASMPVTMAAFTVIQAAVNNFTSRLATLFRWGEDISQTLTQLRDIYELGNIDNHIPDGTEPFPENVQDTAANGVTVEFKNVSFKYPDSDAWALREVSFKIERGSLCVIVGTNGSGKSSILKLLTRLYDVTEGEILIDGRDIRTLRLHDLRSVTSTLFQDFQLYPLSIRNNIRMGNPDVDVDEDLIEQAADLCGVTDFKDRLPNGLDSYLEHPVPDQFQSLPQDTKELFGRPIGVDLKVYRGRVAKSRNVALSGGQSQRVAVARTMLRARAGAGPGSDRVGLLLFDEPSASLDPEAEYKLFTALREMRGNKSMIFSSHRFGNLTRHANIILFMRDSRIMEIGTHDELIAQDGAYAHMWKLQAEAFIG